MNGLESAKVNYNDMTGTATLNFHESSSELRDYAIEKGIDIEKYEPIGIEINYGETDYFDLAFILIDKQNSEEYKSQHNGNLPVIKITVEENQKDFERHFKRFNVQLIMKNNSPKNYDLIESKSIDDLRND